MILGALAVNVDFVTETLHQTGALSANPLLGGLPTTGNATVLDARSSVYRCNLIQQAEVTAAISTREGLRDVHR
jgi:hypothetical protein